MDLREFIREVPDFPKPGILFYDITPLLADGPALNHAVDLLAARFADCGADKIIAAEARGFIFGTPLACRMNIGFVPVRKPGKLPYTTRSVTYDLEYGTDELQVHVDAINPGDKILIIDDLLATGGTMSGMIKMVEEAQAEIVGIGFLIELGFLNGSAKLKGHSYHSLIVY